MDLTILSNKHDKLKDINNYLQDELSKYKFHRNDLMNENNKKQKDLLQIKKENTGNLIVDT